MQSLQAIRDFPIPRPLAGARRSRARSDAFSQDTYWLAQTANRGFQGSADIDADMIRYQDFNFLIYFDPQGAVIGESWDIPGRERLRPDDPRRQRTGFSVSAATNSPPCSTTSKNCRPPARSA
ncbi:hypothetical protein [Pseudomonas schmalbachii]|uniref:Uncharacterized protein n=1 Tax=Pseudomonas schmalbachii TaxID=2816993 RepID=A0ABS3TT68_9PSED|nr:hypothetical protein [Pseudomonas schmalbachii]MBO3276864.1 hypothetical protein [Pseudomonas schmalbachii]